MNKEDLRVNIIHYVNMFKRLFNDFKFKIREFLHLKNNTDYDEIIDDSNIITESIYDDDVSDEDVWSVGCKARSEMINFNRTLHLLKDTVKDDLPDYLIDNLDQVKLVGSGNHLCLEFIFKNYSRMNHSIVNEIREDFRDATGLKGLPSYKMDAYHDSFGLMFFISDYL